MAPKNEPDKPAETTRDLEEIHSLAPFTPQQLRGVRFARGNMLGGASPLESAAPAPWADDPAKSSNVE